jgi:hypothetical protein
MSDVPVSMKRHRYIATILFDENVVRAVYSIERPTIVLQYRHQLLRCHDSKIQHIYCVVNIDFYGGQGSQHLLSSRQFHGGVREVIRGATAALAVTASFSCNREI